MVYQSKNDFLKVFLNRKVPFSAVCSIFGKGRSFYKADGPAN